LRNVEKALRVKSYEGTKRNVAMWNVEDLGKKREKASLSINLFPLL